MVPERIANRLTALPGWQTLLEAGRQSLRRTFAFPDHAGAMLFFGMLSEICEQCSSQPRLDLRPSDVAGRPAWVTVMITAPELADEHFTLARIVDSALLALTPEAN